VAFVVAVIIGAVSFSFVGRGPKVTFSDNSNLATSIVGSTDNSIDLAFSKAGRLGAISVTAGSLVKKGDVLASLDASDSLGTVNQAKGALELAKAQYASMDVQYTNAKKQQDTLVANAYRTLLSSNLVAVAKDISVDVSSSQTPQISGTYICDKEGSYEIDLYASGVPSGYSYTFGGLEKGVGNVMYSTPQLLGSCGLFIQFPAGYSYGFVQWIIDIPNIRSASYVANKNAYDLAVATRDQVLKQFEANLGANSSYNANIAQAAVDSAQGAYETALAAYRNNLIIAPMDGVVTFVDSNLKIGQSVVANKTVITIIKK
jgi:multidrug efflux pump subunit AcrA (membrane-fusion protein)